MLTFAIAETVERRAHELPYVYIFRLSCPGPPACGRTDGEGAEHAAGRIRTFTAVSQTGREPTEAPARPYGRGRRATRTSTVHTGRAPDQAEGSEPDAWPFAADVPTNPGARPLTLLAFWSPPLPPRCTDTAGISLCASCGFVLSDPPTGRRHRGVGRVVAVGTRYIARQPPPSLPSSPWSHLVLHGHRPRTSRDR